MPIRPATEADLPAINAIYNHYVLTSVCTYQITPETHESRLAWFHARQPRHTVTVITPDETNDNNILGWASLSPYHPREAFRYTAETSIYLRHDQRGQGLGTQLLADLVTRARALGLHTLIAAVDSTQAASIALHQKQGFRPVSHFRQIGHKFNQWLDVIDLQLMLDNDEC